LSDPEVVVDDVKPNIEAGSQGEDEQRRRPWYGLLVVILLLMLLLCCAVTTVDIVVTRGPQQARFIARNLACLQCHTELIPDFTKPVVHQPFIKKECTTCHTPHGSQVTAIVTQGTGSTIQRYTTLVQWLPLKWWVSIWEGLSGQSSSSTTVVTSGGKVISKTTKDVAGGKSNLVMPADQLCWMCHGNMGPLLSDAYQHQPFSAGRCTNCHDPHASDYAGLLTQAPNKLCFTCHPIGSEINRAQAHPPAKQGWCIDCHNPHASDFKGILVAQQRELCFRCHPTVAVLADMPVQHQPFLANNCTGCHEPHGSDYPPLLDAPQPGLCYKCHPQIQNQFAQKSHHPIGVELTCGSCHDPHAAQYRGLVNAQNNNFCYQCHGDKRALYEKSPHINTLCIRCHTPHGSQYSPILVDSNPDLCLGCHPTLEGRNKHPVRPSSFDVHAQKGLTCTSTCHDPHGTRFDFMIKNIPAQFDGQCLQCHKYVGIYF
jgi:predicted CXXCH cytochrome family protein